jgi:hypothetical protein
MPGRNGDDAAIRTNGAFTAGTAEKAMSSGNYLARADVDDLVISLIAAASGGHDQIAERARDIGEGPVSRRYRAALIGCPGNGKATLERALTSASSRLHRVLDLIEVEPAHLDRLTESDPTTAPDVVVVVLSATSPVLSLDEMTMLSMMASYHWPLLVVINKIDHPLAPTPPLLRSRIDRLLSRASCEIDRLWCLSAEVALDARLGGREPDVQADDFVAFETELVRLCTQALPGAELRAAQRQLIELARQLCDLLDIETAILDSDGFALSDAKTAISDLALQITDDMTDQCARYAQDLGVLIHRLTTNLRGMARLAPERCTSLLRTTAESISVRALGEQITELSGDLVHADFAEFVRSERIFAQDRWADLACGLTRSAESCINRLRIGTNELLGSSLPPVIVDPSDLVTPPILPVLSFRPLPRRIALERLRGVQLIFGSSVARRRLLERTTAQLEAEVSAGVTDAVETVSMTIERRYLELYKHLTMGFVDSSTIMFHGIAHAEAMLGLSRDDRRRAIERNLSAREFVGSVVRELS